MHSWPSPAARSSPSRCRQTFGGFPLTLPARRAPPSKSGLLLGYGVVTMAHLTHAGPRVDIRGRVRLYNLGVAILTVGSARLYLAPSSGTPGAGELVGFRPATLREPTACRPRKGPGRGKCPVVAGPPTAGAGVRVHRACNGPFPRPLKAACAREDRAPSLTRSVPSFPSGVPIPPG